MDRGLDAIVASRRGGQPAPRPASVVHVGGDAGTVAIIASRRPDVATGFVSLGQATDPLIVAVHESLSRSRDRIYTTTTPLPAEQVAQFEQLWGEWVPFFTVPFVRGPNARERAEKFAASANYWEKVLDAREVQPEAPPSRWPLVVAAVLGIGVVAAAAYKPR
ncbi:hypothetical protein [Polyangium sp. 15x6]|uniref:hypothetical protein n=1 Tax=Polyangium sp. 15x6 TaxID=3042687 RepID=UPI00249C4FE9|nr:hypothetical protein [Polyangium sp. 15x6]MDI3285171.1 hypothetical protein [Polyangium sp. 15x6]